MSHKSDYARLSALVKTAEAGGLAKERSALLLWFLRNVVGLDDLDAYEFVCDGDLDSGIDGLYLEPPSGDDNREVLVIYQSKYTHDAKPIGRTALEGLLATANHFKDGASVVALLAGRVEPKLRELIKRFDLVRKLRDGWYADGRLRLRLVFVTSGTLTPEASKLVEATNRSERDGYAVVYDLTRLSALAVAVAAPTAPEASVSVPSTPGERVVLTTGGTRVAMVAVKAREIVSWPGIDDRSLFELNVRRELRLTRVREQLDGAIRRPHEHKDFLAYHNGMTVVCDAISEEPTRLVIANPSIVNGAQSTIALALAADEGALTDDLRIFVKFVDVAARPQLAKEVSWRSNTQTAVNARNLVALGGPQERIKKEFERDYPGIMYQLRPDASLGTPPGMQVIDNDDAAQLVCAIFNAMPWLAVKRLSLFESENHAMIFPEEITASHVVLSDMIRQCIDAQREKFPERYRRSWRLSRLVAVYLVGEVLRADDELKKILDDPGTALRDRQALEEKIDLPVRIAAATLGQRHDQRIRDSQADEFNVDFKRREVLHELRDKARDNYILARAVGRVPS